MPRLRARGVRLDRRLSELRMAPESLNGSRPAAALTEDDVALHVGLLILALWRLEKELNVLKREPAPQP